VETADALQQNGDIVTDILLPVEEAVATTLVENHREFLRFLTRRVGDTTTAEDILQQVALKAVRKSSGIKDQGSIVAWLYSLLKTTLIDHYRKESSENRLKSEFAQFETVSENSVDEIMQQAICGCITGLLATLKPEYAEIIKRIDLDENKPGLVAKDMGIDANTVRVRLHRARQALKQALLLSCRTCAEHGCLDCDCA